VGLQISLIPDAQVACLRLCVSPFLGTDAASEYQPPDVLRKLYQQRPVFSVVETSSVFVFMIILISYARLYWPFSRFLFEGFFILNIYLKKNLTRKSCGGHQAKRRIKEEKTKARGTGRHATASALPSSTYLFEEHFQLYAHVWRLLHIN
jgi:hypothetical protein